MNQRGTWPSNTATPRYYDEFRSRVMSGEIPVCREISLEMNRIDERIADPAIYYDPRPVEGYIAFTEGEMTKTDGGPLRLLDTFKLWAEQLYGWYYYAPTKVWVANDRGGGKFVERLVIKRLINKLWLILARGGAKSMFLSTIHSYELILNGRTTHQVTTAPTMRQADEVMSPIRTAIVRAPGPLFKFLTHDMTSNLGAGINNKPLLVSTKRGIEMQATGSLLEIRPMRIDKLQGLRSGVNTIDEWLSTDTREPVLAALEQGASKVDNYIIVAASSEGTVRNGTGDDVKQELMDILTGKYQDPHTCIFHYKLDHISEMNDPETWLKAQPNLGYTVSYETYERDKVRADNSTTNRHDIIAKRFGIPMSGSTYFFRYSETIPHPRRTYRGMDCIVGADLSQGDDFCSFSMLFPMRGEKFGIKTLNFVTDRTYSMLTPSFVTLYDKFIAEGSLWILEGTVLDEEEVFEALYSHIVDNGYNPVGLGYDPYNAEKFVKLWTDAFGTYAVDKVRQGARTESVPLGELKKLAEDRKLLFDEDIMMFAMGNAMVLEDTNGNRKLYKKRYEEKIDPVSATMDAYVVYKKYIDLFF